MEAVEILTNPWLWIGIAWTTATAMGVYVTPQYFYDGLKGPKFTEMNRREKLIASVKLAPLAPLTGPFYFIALLVGTGVAALGVFGEWATGGHRKTLPSPKGKSTKKSGP